VHLRPFIRSGTDDNVLLDAFIETARDAPGDAGLFKEAVDALGSARLASAIAATSTSTAELRRFFSERAQAGCPAAHHSDRFRAAYRPAYRVIAARFLEHLGGRG